MPIIISDEILTSSGLTEKEVRRELAIALFQNERLTLAQAAKVADQTQLEFQKLLASRRIPMHYGIEELQADLLFGESQPIACRSRHLSSPQSVGHRAPRSAEELVSRACNSTGRRNRTFAERR